MTDEPSRTRDLARVRFGVYELDLETGELRRDGSPFDLPPQPTRVLQLLVARAGRLVTRDELREHLWPDTVVEFDHGLNTCVRQIREALGERAGSPTHIQTVPRRGYRFIAPVQAALADAPAPGGASAPGKGRSEAPSPGPRRTRPLVLALTSLVVALGGAWALGGFGRPEGTPRIAVLPFENLSPDGISPAFVEGLSEELVVELARHDPAELAVLSRGSAQRLAEAGRSPREIGAALDATHLVVGTARATGGALEVTASLVRTSDQTTLWSARFAARELDPAAQMGPVGRRIAGALTRALEPAPVARASPDREAGLELLRGRHQLANHRPAEAVGHLERAVRRDPEFALAHALLARARLGTGDAEGAAAAAARALALAPGLPETHQALGDVAAMARWDWTTALEEYRRAIELEPGAAELRQGRAYVLSLLGRHAEAIAEIELALSLDPVSPLVNGDAAWLYLYARRPTEAVEQARATVALAPDHASAWYCLVTALEARGDLTGAREVAGRVAERYRAPAEVVAEIRAASPAAGIDRFWRWDLDQMEDHELAARYPLDFAAAYARFREPDRALAFIERSIESRIQLAPIIGVDPRFDPIRSEPRFARALAQLNLRASAQGS